ncbi:MAG: hypothetical protein U0521_09525 [Anaerolineae bacterium]
MKSYFINFAMWLNSDPRRAKFILVGATLALALTSAGAAAAGPMGNGGNVIGGG